MIASPSVGHRPKVSVVIPNYNHGRFLGQRFASIFDQTFQDFEVIFLDDASRDDSLDRFAKVASHPKVAKSIVNERNTGSPYRQWNRGAREARGEYLWIAESDDYADTQFLERTVTVLDAHPRVGIAFCKSTKVDENSQEIGTTEDWTRDLGPLWAADFVARGKDECGRYLMQKCMIPNVSSALVRLQALRQIGYAHEAMRYCGDYFTYAKLLEISDLAYLSTPLNYFRFSSQTMRTQMSASWLHEYERTEILGYVSGHFPLTDSELGFASRSYMERLIRICIRDWRFAVAFASRFPLLRARAAKFCPHFEAKLAKVFLEMLSLSIRNRVRATRVKN